MDGVKLNEIDSGDIGDVLKKIEKSFGFHFERKELEHIKTYGELCDIIVKKIKLPDSGDCSTQQAFHKLRDAISVALNIDKKTITPQTLLTTIISAKHLRKNIKQVEKNLGFTLRILRPSHLVSGIILVIFGISLITLFLKWQYGLTGITISFIGRIVSGKLANKTRYTTIGEIAEKITRENYLKVRGTLQQ